MNFLGFLKTSAKSLPFGVLIFLFAQTHSGTAQQIKVGSHIGALGAAGSSGIGYGASLAVIPYDEIGFVVDATFAKLASDTFYFSSSPSLVFYLPGPEELKFGALVGGGFYKIENLSMKFGINGGVTADFLLAPNLFVGANLRLHKVFDLEDTVWNVFLTLSYAFAGTDGGW